MSFCLYGETSFENFGLLYSGYCYVFPFSEHSFEGDDHIFEGDGHEFPDDQFLRGDAPDIGCDSDISKIYLRAKNELKKQTYTDILI